MRSPVGKPGRRRYQGVDAVIREQDCVIGGLGELLDAGSDVDGVADKGELELAPTADGACDHRTGVDTNADSQRAAESLGDEAVNPHRRGHRGVGMIGEIVGSAEHDESTIAEELVDMPTGLDDGRHDDFEKGVEAGHGVLGSVGLSERGELPDVDEHHGHVAALTGEHVITLFEQPRRQSWVDVGAERGLKPLPLSQTGLHAVERRRQRAEVVVLNYRQAVAVVARRYAFRSFGEVANGLQGW